MVPRSEHLANSVFGLNVIWWGVAGLLFSAPIDRWTVVRVCISSQHFLIGLLLLLRSPVGLNGSTPQLLSAVPSLAICGVAFVNSPPPHQWPFYAQLMFALTTAFGLASLIFLGKNFAILPALRSVSTSGPYGWVRHPVYVAELGMVVATVLAGPNIWGIFALFVLIPSLVWRIHSEESLLVHDAAYQRYTDTVRWRLLPWVW